MMYPLDTSGEEWKCHTRSSSYCYQAPGKYNWRYPRTPENSLLSDVNPAEAQNIRH
jgi:hypothetical protein